MTKLIITGTGRCGTTWASEVLQHAGINCGHQAVFRHEHSLGRRWDWGEHVADSSFEAVPLLHLNTHNQVLWLRRPCDDVVRSWLKLGAFSDTMREDFLLWSIVLDRDFPGLLDLSTSQERAEAYCQGWAEMASPFVDVTCDLYDLSEERLVKTCQELMM